MNPASNAGASAPMRLRDLVDLLLLAALWGGSFLFMRIGAKPFGAIAMAGLRTGIAALVLVALLSARGRSADMRVAPGAMLIMGLLNSAIPFALFGFASLSLKAGFSAILNATAPFWGALVAFAWLGERMTRLRVFGLLVGFSGVVVLVWGRLDFGAGGAGPAIVAALSATLLYGIAANYAKRSLTGIGPLANATGSQLAAALVLLPFTLAYWPAEMPGILAWLAVIAMAVLSTALAYVIYFRLIANVGATRAITVTFLIPVTGMLWGWLFLDEAVTWNMAAGALVILLGTALTTGLIRMPAAKA